MDAAREVAPDVMDVARRHEVERLVAPVVLDVFGRGWLRKRPSPDHVRATARVFLLVSAGHSFNEAFAAVAEDAPKETHPAWLELSKADPFGGTFADAFDTHSAIFPAPYRAIFRRFETAGEPLKRTFHAMIETLTA